MTTQRWLQLASALTGALLLFVIAVAWHSATDEKRRAEDIGARTQATIERIEAKAQTLENEAGR